MVIQRTYGDDDPYYLGLNTEDYGKSRFTKFGVSKEGNIRESTPTPPFIFFKFE
jgi:hypothetical protein